MTPFSRRAACALGAAVMWLAAGAASASDFTVLEMRVAVDAEVSLAGALTIPSGDVRAAVVMISGTGHHGRDVTISGFPLFRAMAEELAAQGIATLRLDESGVGESTGPHTAHFGQRVPHMIAGLDALKNRPELAGRPVGLLGHSEGAMVAPLVYAERDAQVDFLILLAAPGVAGRDV